MKKVVKSVSLIIFVAMMFGLVACGGGTQSAASDKAVPAPTQQQSLAAETEAAAVSNVSNSKDIKVCIPDSPIKEKIQTMVALMQEQYTEGKITFEIYPFARAVETIVKGEADMMIPYIYSADIKSDQYIFSSAALYDTVMILYTNKESNKEITPENISNFKVEAMTAHGKFFNNIPESEKDAGLQKVSSGRLDGYISAPSADVVLAKLGLKNIKRNKYAIFDSKVIFPNTERGKEIEKIISDIITKIKPEDKYKQIVKDLNLSVFIPDAE